MYIKRLQNFTEQDWRNYFNQFPLIETRQEEALVKKILFSSKKDIEKQFIVLKVFGVINGIGPGYVSQKFRNIITFFFSSVRYEWHDIEYGIFGTEHDKIKADNGLLKYSLLGFYDNLINLSKLSVNTIFKVIMTMFYLPFGILQIIVSVFCWGMVRLFGKSAFSYIKINIGE